MDKVSEAAKDVGPQSIGFVQYIFNFDDETKCELMNMGQYSLLALIPIMIMLKGIKHFIPEEDESKGSLEILAESVGQIMLILIGLWFANRLVRYIPTYSGCEYGKFNPVNFLIPFLLILTTMQTKLGAKLNILAERVTEIMLGKEEELAKGAKKRYGGKIKVTQPLAGQHQPSQADFMDHSQLLPSNPQLTAMPQIPSNQPQQKDQNFDQMYQQNAGVSVDSQMVEPMAANAAIGGGMFGGSAW